MSALRDTWGLLQPKRVLYRIGKNYLTPLSSKCQKYYKLLESWWHSSLNTTYRLYISSPRGDSRTSPERLWCHLIRHFCHPDHGRQLLRQCSIHLKQPKKAETEAVKWWWQNIPLKTYTKGCSYEDRQMWECVAARAWYTFSRAHWQKRNTRGANQVSWHQFTRAYQMLRASAKDIKGFQGSGLIIWWPLLLFTCFSFKCILLLS